MASTVALVYGPDLLARWLERPNSPDKYGNVWQYNPRSDRHSKIGCWGVAFDLLRTSALLRQHAAQGKVVLGVNHEMVDHSTGRKKDLDLVIARPAAADDVERHSFKSLVDHFGVPLLEPEQDALDALPDISGGRVGAVLIALEAKAAMTAHVKALPRLYDELNSSHLAVHGASSQALAIAYVQINAAEQFASPTKNLHDLGLIPLQSTKHTQPKDVQRVLAKVNELPRRSSTRESGFDGIGVTVVDFDNRGGPVSLVARPPAPQPGEPFEYGQMITRMANEYDSTFARI